MARVQDHAQGFNGSTVEHGCGRCPWPPKADKEPGGCLWRARPASRPRPVQILIAAMTAQDGRNITEQLRGAPGRLITCTARGLTAAHALKQNRNEQASSLAVNRSDGGDGQPSSRPSGSSEPFQSRKRHLPRVRTRQSLHSASSRRRRDNGADPANCEAGGRSTPPYSAKRLE
jgi:hypothetical protein